MMTSMSSYYWHCHYLLQSFLLLMVLVRVRVLVLVWGLEMACSRLLSLYLYHHRWRVLAVLRLC